MATRKGKAKPEEVLAAKCKVTLDRHWAEVRQRAESGDTSDYLTDPHLIEAIRASLADSANKTYHYVLITQLVSKITSPKLNACSLQERAEVEGSFDARTVCRKTIVPFDRAQLDGALGRSPDPYVNNPVRVPLLIKDDRGSKSDPGMWDKLCDVVDSVEEADDEEFTETVFRQVLLEIYRKLGSTVIRYDVPLRVSLAQVVNAIEEFIREPSGGDRPLALAAALFEIVGRYFKIFARVTRGRITASDEALGQAADIECSDSQGKVAVAVEVKDRAVTISDVEEKLGTTRGKGIKEVFFVSARTTKQAEGVPERVAREFAAGQNLHVFNLIELARPVLALAGEAAARSSWSLSERSLTRTRIPDIGWRGKGSCRTYPTTSPRASTAVAGPQ